MTRDSTRDSARVTRDSTRDSTVMTRAQLCCGAKNEKLCLIRADNHKNGRTPTFRGSVGARVMNLIGLVDMGHG